uniref:Gypsy retrotransposon integrase-like protein 1 n=1 Tax=Cajanus cajan TaxID=3821 RepID=A0A151R6E0_CAJCA|nr:Gypsy retrotransposon integrase-like protein 1 [Cajanus cajan]
MVEKLGLTTTSHPKPYQLHWLNDDGDMVVNQQVEVEFSIGNYQDKFKCDVVPMEACHILLGRPWQFDKQTNHDGLTNKITFTHKDLGWMAGIWSYLKEGVLPENKDEARKIRMRSAKFIIIGDELFKHGISSPLLKCLTASQAAYVIREVHQGICGMHSGARSMATRVLRAGYYWPTLKSDCQAHVQKCKECQQFGNAHRQPPETLHHMMSAWPFSQWGMDILGPFPPAKGQLKFLLVAIDYFTKWIEACPLAKITTENVRKFTWKNIICRIGKIVRLHGLPKTIVSDRDVNFNVSDLSLFTGLATQEEDALDLRTNPLQEGGDDGGGPWAKGPITRTMAKRIQEEWAQAQGKPITLFSWALTQAQVE